MKVGLRGCAVLSTSMKLKEIKAIKYIVSARIGRVWPLILLKALVRKNAIFNKTRWSKIRGLESDFIKRMSSASALYVRLGERLGRYKAFEVMEELLVSIGCEEQWNHLNSMDSAEGSEMKRLMAFNELIDRKGAPQFNTREYITQDDNTCHFLITRCVFNDFFAEAGTPELTKLFCKVDHRFFPEAFPGLTFHRGNSWENTIAYGKEHCEFVFEKKEET